MLQTFTLSFQDCNHKSSPKVFVLFTNFSRYPSESEMDSNLSYDDEEEEPPSGISFEDLVIRFREELVARLMEDQGLETFYAQMIVNIIFPNENFYAYKVSKNQTNE